MVASRSVARAFSFGLFVAALGALAQPACSANGGSDKGLGGSGGSSGSSAGSSGSGADGGGGSSATGGTGGTVAIDAGADATKDASETDGNGVVNDAQPDVIGEACAPDAGTAYIAGPQKRHCAAATTNECDHGSDINPQLANGSYGNSFDDDCDGQVDEGCDCDPNITAGQTKACWLVSPTQVDGSNQAVGWCKTNSLGSERCVTVGTGEFAKGQWDGECRGAQLPFADDVCAPGDFDCDGLPSNSQTDDCSCASPVECPTGTIVTAPFPVVSALPFIDGQTFIPNAALKSLATGWKWTATGGDCDNILPHPSFAIFNGPSGAFAVTAVQTNGLGQGGNQVGYVLGPGQAAKSKVYVAFGLSGDYLVTGEFDLKGKHYACTTKVQVRAPGIRAELCWAPMPSDVDLHFARLQNPDSCTPVGDAGTTGHGWFQTCRTDQRADDCYYLTASGCTGFGTDPSPWGYARSAASACHGWGSRRQPGVPCDNPRLDFDNISCDPVYKNPMSLGGIPTDFCGAENTNIDNPKNGDRFAIGAHAFGFVGSVQPHVNVYCNGERRLSVGYEPNGQVNPIFSDAGGIRGGDLWDVGIVEAVVDGAGKMTDCKIDTVHSKVARTDRDGSTAVCVDTNPMNSATPLSERDWLFMSGGGVPAAADDLCWH